MADRNFCGQDHDSFEIVNQVLPDCCVPSPRLRSGYALGHLLRQRLTSGHNAVVRSRSLTHGASGAKEQPSPLSLSETFATFGKSHCQFGAHWASLPDAVVGSWAAFGITRGTEGSLVTAPRQADHDESEFTQRLRFESDFLQSAAC